MEVGKSIICRRGRQAVSLGSSLWGAALSQTSQKCAPVQCPLGATRLSFGAITFGGCKAFNKPFLWPDSVLVYIAWEDKNVWNWQHVLSLSTSCPLSAQTYPSQTCGQKYKQKKKIINKTKNSQPSLFSVCLPSSFLFHPSFFHNNFDWSLEDRKWEGKSFTCRGSSHKC